MGMKQQGGAGTTFRAMAVIGISLFAFAVGPMLERVLGGRRWPPLPADQRLHPLLQVLISTVPLVFPVLVALVAAWPSPRKKLGYVLPAPAFRVWPQLIIASFGVVVAADLLFGVWGAARDGNVDWMKNSLYSFQTDGPIISFILNTSIGAVALGVGQCTLCFGLLQRRLAPLWGVSAAIGISATLFSLVAFATGYGHHNLVLGVWLGFLAWRSESILPSIVAHASTIMCAAVWARFTDGATPAAAPGYSWVSFVSEWTTWGRFGIAAVGVVLMVRLLRRWQVESSLPIEAAETAESERPAAV